MADLADLLTSTLHTLNLRPPDISPGRFSTFPLFPHLPAELRLKIFSKALPKKQSLRLKGEILIADREWGLYLTFKIQHAPARPSTTSFSLPQPPPIGWYKEARNLDLLNVNHECRTVYLEGFPLSLPSGHQSSGRIRYSPEEIIHIVGFRSLVQEPQFRRAVFENWRLQSFEFQKLCLPISYFTSPDQQEITRFKALREIWVELWTGFEGLPERNQEQMKEGMKVHLAQAEDRLREFAAENNGYFVPSIQFLA